MVGFTGKNSRQACAAEALITRRDALHAIRRQCLDDSAIGGRFDRHADAGMRCWCGPLRHRASRCAKAVLPGATVSPSPFALATTHYSATAHSHAYPSAFRAGWWGRLARPVHRSPVPPAQAGFPSFARRCLPALSRLVARRLRRSCKAPARRKQLSRYPWLSPGFTALAVFPSVSILRAARKMKADKKHTNGERFRSVQNRSRR